MQRQYYWAKRDYPDIRNGPENVYHLRQKVANGEINGTDLVWREGWREWATLETLPLWNELLDDSIILLDDGMGQTTVHRTWFEQLLAPIDTHKEGLVVLYGSSALLMYVSGLQTIVGYVLDNTALIWSGRVIIGCTLVIVLTYNRVVAGGLVAYAIVDMCIMAIHSLLQTPHCSQNFLRALLFVGAAIRALDATYKLNNPRLRAA